MTHYRSTQVRATFTGCNIKAGKVALQFELGPDDRYTLPTLALLTGEKVTLNISSDQTVLLLNEGTGEIIDNDPEQMQIETEEPEEVQADEEEADADTEGQDLPPAATAYDEELDEIFGADAA